MAKCPACEAGIPKKNMTLVPYENGYIVRVAEIEKCGCCKEWEETGRFCTLRTHGECDCPKCQGLCDCEDLLDEDSQEE